MNKYDSWRSLFRDLSLLIVLYIYKKESLIFVRQNYDKFETNSFLIIMIGELKICVFQFIHCRFLRKSPTYIGVKALFEEKKDIADAIQGISLSEEIK